MDYKMKKLIYIIILALIPITLYAANFGNLELENADGVFFTTDSDGMITLQKAGDNTSVELLKLVNTDEGESGEIAQGSQISMYVKGTVDEGLNYTDYEVARIVGRKTGNPAGRDFWSDGSLADFDAELSIHVMENGVLSATPQFWIGRGGQDGITIPEGAYNAPSLSFNGAGSTGLFRSTVPNGIGFSNGTWGNYITENGFVTGIASIALSVASNVTAYARDGITLEGSTNDTNELSILFPSHDPGSDISTTMGTVYTKTDTGDPAFSWEGLFAINTFDENVKIYADSSWQTITPVVNIDLRVETAKLPTTNPAVIDGSGVWKLLYDDTTDESASWSFIMPSTYGGGTLYCDIFYSMAGANSSDTVAFEVSMAAYSPGDGTDIDSKSDATVNYLEDTCSDTAGAMILHTVTLTNDDSVAAGDWVRLTVARDADASGAGSDSATGDCEILKIVVRN